MIKEIIDTCCAILDAIQPKKETYWIKTGGNPGDYKRWKEKEKFLVKGPGPGLSTLRDQLRD